MIHRHARLTLGIVIAAQLLAAPRALAVWPSEPYAGHVLICGATSFQYDPVAVSDGAGGSITVWYDYRSGSNYDIYAQRINAAGQPV